MHLKRGFTLIELLVVITIIGVLATVATVMYGAVREKARRQAATTELRKVAEGIALAQNKTDKTLAGITNRGCSICACQNNGALQDNVGCIAAWNNALQDIQDAGGAVEGLTSIGLDPWGRPYLVDENEGEFGSTDCRRDFIQSSGPDGWYVSSCGGCLDDPDDPPGVPCTGPEMSDDILIKLPRVQTHCQPVAETCTVGL